MLPAYREEADETTVLPAYRPEAPADRVPRGIFRDEDASPSAAESETERTRELPQISGDPAADRAAYEQPGRPRRPRPDWAEETPLDDLPTLADELLGGHDDDNEDGFGSGRRRPRR